MLCSIGKIISPNGKVPSSVWSRLGSNGEILSPKVKIINPVEKVFGPDVKVFGSKVKIISPDLSSQSSEF